MCSDFLFRLCIAVSALVMTFETSAAKQRKCVYFFGTCYSCEAPLTCENSRPVETKSSPKPKKRSVVRRSDPPPLPDTKIKPAPPPAVALPPAKLPAASLPAANLPTERRVNSQLRKSTGFDREFKQFQTFMRNRQVGGQQPDARKLQEMYFAYRLWLSRQPRRSSENTN